MKRILSFVLALVLLIGLMPMQALASENEANLWEGRSAVFVGDSITAGTGTTKIYYEYLKETFGFGSVTAMGVPGSCISAASDYGQSTKPLIGRYQNIPSADLIVVFMGTNDYGHETPLGSVEDTQDGTFYGALNTIVPALVAKHPSSKIVFVTSLHRYGFGTSKILGTQFTYDNIPNGVGATLGDYVDALKTVCASNGVSVIDLHTECTLDPTDSAVRSIYIPDGLHPNAAGHELIAGIMESHIRSYEPVEKAPEIETEPEEETELIYGNKFTSGFDQKNRASARVNQYLKAGTVITLKNPDVFQWSCAKTNGENSSTNLGYFPDSQWTDKETAVVAEDGWVGFVFKYRDETQVFDLSKPLSDYITIEEPHTHSYESTVTTPTCTEKGYTTYTCECGDSYVDDYVDTTGEHPYENGVCTGCGVAQWDTDGDGVLEILAIGNSFSVDALEYAYQIAQDLGIEEIVIGNLYIGGCSLNTHATNAAGDLAKYTYYYNDNGSWKTTSKYKISTALESRSWDYVSMQQASNYSGVESTYNEDLTNLIAYVQERSDAKLVWHMTWAYQQNSTHSAFPTYNKDQMTMYNAIVSAVQNKIVTNSNFDLIVPNGTAVQNSRTSLQGDTTTRDGYHMSYDYGRYLTGLLFIKTVTGLSIDGVTYAPSGVDAEEKAIAIESANNAAAKPFAVTKSKYVNEVPEEGYILLQTPIYQGAYWHPLKAGSYNELIDDQSNSPNFFATIRFTRETLPVGSIITLKSGWQYRPDGWVTDELQTGTRESVTTKAFQIVTEEWWGDYTIRSFNISRTSGGSVMDLTEEEMREIFQIYVPEERHSHDYTSVVTASTCTEQGYTTHTCTLCGDSYVDSHVDATGHSYANGTCTICGAEHPNLANYKGKVISILGGSNCTFAGYIPVADGFNLEHRSRYPDTSRIPDVTDVSQTWWMQLLSQMDAKLGINDSWAGSQVLNTLDSNSGDLGPDAAMASLTRIQNLGANGTPDVILFFGGCNDIGRSVTLGSFDPATAPTQADLTATKWESFADAYVAAITRMQHFYPNAKILVMLPYNSPTYFTASKVEKYGAVIRAICDHYGVDYVDLRDSGINSNHLPDNIHPNAEGSDYITTAVLDALLSSVELEAGEHIVHSVTHELTGVTSSLSYYKGVSDGKSFVTTITGEDVTVAVTMGGVDITNQVYADGKVMISAVTGDVVITAKGTYNADGRLQQLPDDYCCNTNLWTALDPVNEYYTTSGWGNNSNSNYSVTFPVTPGDQIWATSFGAAGTNGYSANAVRITWFGEDGVLKSLGRDVVYAEFAEYGYITVPEGATAVNIPMVSNADTWEIYILNRDHTYEKGICTGCGGAVPALEGKTISILGASISTYAGTSNGAAADTSNSTIRNNAKYYPHSVVTDVALTDTWWMQAANDLGLRLLVNNSWSGSSLLYERNGTVGAYVDRCVQLHDDTGSNAGEVPDIIGIQMGTNDFQYYKDTLGTADIDYDALITEKEDGSYAYATPETSLEAAAIVLHKISVRYPDAEVYYLNISQRVDDTDALIRSFNAELKEVVEHFGAHIVDIYGSAITMADFDTYIGDGRVHPNCLGMDAYTEAFKRALLDNTAYTADTHTVSLALDGVTADYGDDKIVVSGGSYAVNLSTAAEMDLDVTVTMGGKDITAAVYKNGAVSIECVSDDVTITAKSVHTPRDYRWEFDGTDLACVSGDNTLTKKAGSTTNGVFSKTCYALENKVVLLHDQSWAVEWKCSGTFLNTNGSSGARIFTSDDVNANYNARYIFKSNTNGIIAMGEKTSTGSHNYGIALADHNIDWTAVHTYRLENRIAANGSNIIYLFVDEKEIGPMNHYYIGTRDQNTTSDWLSGKDFVFPYMGTDTHGFTNASIDYIQVWESGAPEASRLVITQQPANAEAKLGERYCVTVEAEGEGLKYQWYLRNAGAKSFSKSSVKDNTYDDVMTTARAGREVYCVITDTNGNSVTTDTVKLICLPSEELAIVTQPTDGEAVLGERYCVTVEAKGEGLKYQWYFRNKGAKNWTKSSVTDNTYDDIMTTARDGREVYCVITDLAGNTVTTNTVKLIRVIEELVITKQPVDGEATLGENYCVTVEAKGEGLRYQWYFRNKGAKNWTKSGVTDNTYDDVMTTARAGREVYCVITDKYGNSVTTDIVKLIRVPAKLEIITQPTDAAAAFDEMFCATVEATGEGLKYQWYYRNAGTNTWHKSGVRDNTYDDVMTKARNGREIYCVITDAYGNTVTTDIVKLIAVPKVELQLLSVSYESAAMGDRYCVTVEAQGEGLTYQWYFRNAGSSTWYKSSVTDNTYDDVMTTARANREVYCVITDAFGNQVTTDVVVLKEKTDIVVDAFPDISQFLAAQTSSQTSVGAAQLANVNLYPIFYNTNTAYANSKLRSVDIPVKTVSSLTEEQTITLYVADSSILNTADMAAFLTSDAVREYTIVVDVSEYSSTTIRDSVTVDLSGYDIFVGENELIGFGSAEDTVEWTLLSTRQTSPEIHEEMYLSYTYGNKLVSGGIHYSMLFNFEIEVSDDRVTEEAPEDGDSGSEDVEPDVPVEDDEPSDVPGDYAVLDGLNLSILGDSISTYKGYSNDAANTNSTIGSNNVYYNGSNGLSGVEDTWWMQTVNDTGMNLLVNNSWSGSYVVGGLESVNAGVGNRAENLHDNTGDNAGTLPDVIAVYMGTNDLSKKVGDYTSAGFYDNLYVDSDGDGVYDDPTTFAHAYAIMLDKITKAYPEAEIFTFTILANNWVNASVNEKINAAIQEISTYYGATVVDIYAETGITAANAGEYMLDNEKTHIHPNETGMDLITEAFKKALLEKFQGQ